MKNPFSPESFREVKLFVATPLYEGICMSNYLTGMIDLFCKCTAYDIPLVFQSVSRDALIQRARNTCAALFPETDCTHFLFIDADIGFTGYDVLSVLRVMANDEEKKYDVIGGPCPKKKFRWEKIRDAVKKGLVDDDPDLLNKYGADYAFSVPEGSRFRLNEPSEVIRIGTGFMMIAGRTFEKIREQGSIPDYLNEEGKRTCAFFECTIDPGTLRHLGEDFTFCQRVKEVGGRIWTAPWLQLSHQGTYLFQGSYADLASGMEAGAEG